MNRFYSSRLMPFLRILAGTFLTAAAFGLIVVPQGFAAGGVTGFCRTLQRLLPVELPLLVLAVNAMLLILGLVFVGKQFAAKTVAVSLSFPFALDLFSRIVLPDFPAPLFGVLLGGLLLGTGSGLILRGNASGGGFDILAVVLNKKTGIPVAVVMNFCDCTVILMQAMRQPLNQTLCGLGVITLSSLCVNAMVSGRSLRIPFSFMRKAAAQPQ